MPPAQPDSVEVRMAGLSARTAGQIIHQIAAHSAGVCCGIFSCLLLAAGCGAPGLPTPPSPPIPTAVTDLTARQSGDGALLSFTLPGKTITGKRLAESPACEIFRGTLKPDGSADVKSFHMVYAIPSAMVANYVIEKHVEFLDPLSPEDTRAHPGDQVAYLVRTRTSPKKASSDSNIVELTVFPVPRRIASVDAHVTESAIVLSWPAVTQTSGGESLSDVSYRLYRGQLTSPADQATLDAVAKDLVHARWKSPLALLASPAGNSYRDTDFVFDETYVYEVRTAVAARGGVLESADSIPAIITPKDTFPPSAPLGLVAAVLEGNPAAAPVVDLSWSISPEADVAGYRVYRSEREGERGNGMASELVPTPAYRDTSVQPGHRYWYTVTAVDRAGNESPASTPAMAEIAQPSS
jgi:hypothetical protein